MDLPLSNTYSYRYYNIFSYQFPCSLVYLNNFRLFYLPHLIYKEILTLYKPNILMPSTVCPIFQHNLHSNKFVNVLPKLTSRVARRLPSPPTQKQPTDLLVSV